ncbi:hypothetical protein GY45DRAFT_377269 [Cubamyces sp. BRFM 1775]|nr:hypothetical protein GY45DRAFT_377269 [Cubamyces sp. BRFM 1775]
MRCTRTPRIRHAHQPPLSVGSGLRPRRSMSLPYNSGVLRESYVELLLRGILRVSDWRTYSLSVFRPLSPSLLRLALIRPATMGQFWTLRNIDRHVVYEHAKLGDWLFYSDHISLLMGLMAPVQLPRYVYDAPTNPDICRVAGADTVGRAREYDSWLTEGPPRVTQRGPLFTLPDELFGAIFAELASDEPALFCFALTCKDLLALAKQAVRDVLSRAEAPWANCRMICLGDYVDDITDLPEGMFTAEERARIDAALAAHAEAIGGIPQSDNCKSDPESGLLRRRASVKRVRTARTRRRTSPI